MGRALREAACGSLDLEAVESGMREALHRAGSRMLGRLLNAGRGGYKGTQADCGRGHQARFVEMRGKELVTVLGPVRLRRAYYWCEACGCGLAPRDEELDVVRTGFRPGVRRMIGRVGAKEPFDEGRRDLEELAGLRLTAKALERVERWRAS